MATSSTGDVYFEGQHLALLMGVSVATTHVRALARLGATLKKSNLRKRIGWGFGDQALSSITNLGLNMAVARMTSPRDFGEFGLIFTGYVLLLGISRSFSTDALVIRFSDKPEQAWITATRKATGAIFFIGTLLGTCFMAAGFSVPRGGSSLIALGLVLPGLLVQDGWRAAFFTAAKPRSAMINDSLWAATMLVLFFAFGAVGGTATVANLILIWGGAATIAAIVGAFQARLVPKPTQAVEWLKKHLDLGSRYAAEFLVAAGAGYFAVYVISAIAGIEAAGAMRGAQVLLGPMNILFSGVTLVAVPEGIRAVRNDPRRLLRFSSLLSIALTLIATLWTLCVFLLPTKFGVWLLGDTWVAASAVAIPLGLAMVGTSLSAGAIVGLRTVGAAVRSLRARLIAAPMIIGFAGVGAVYGGAIGGSFGVAIAMWLAAIAWWIQLRKIATEIGEKAP